MKKTLPYIINLVRFNIFFFFVIFLFPYVYILITQNNTLNLAGNLFGLNIFSANITEGFISSHVDLMGIILISVLSCLLTFATKEIKKFDLDILNEDNRRF